jgi:hypothetical protein
MSSDGGRPDPPGLETFNQNRAAWPPERLAGFVNQHIAWSADGTQILASGTTWEEVEDKLRAAGVNPNQAVFEYVPDPDVAYLG